MSKGGSSNSDMPFGKQDIIGKDKGVRGMEKRHHKKRGHKKRL
jgi:hypothetical protein